MQQIIRTLAVIILSAILGGVIIWLVPQALEDQAKGDCYKWQKYAEQYEGFYLTQSQADQCEAVKIQVNAPIQ